MRLSRETIMAAFQQAAALAAAGNHAGAAALWREIAEAAPASAEAWHNLGRSLAAMERYDQAEAAYRDALARRPDALWANRSLAGLLQRLGRWREAEPVLANALRLAPDDPNVRTDYGHLVLGLGDFARGWPLYESRKDVASHGSPRLPLPNEWQGEPLAGKSLLIWPEQGFGDQIQFARFAPMLQAAGADVTLVCPPELADLLRQLPVRVVEQAGSTTLPVCDHWTLVMSVPGRLGLSLADISGAAYFNAPSDRRERLAAHAPPGAIGIAWRGRPTHPNDAHRSLASARTLSGPLEAQGFSVVDLSGGAGDFADLAAIVEQLDLVVTVDTALAHLAGALGKPCWVLLPWYQQDWRWLQDREDSPWYDTVRLFRQAPGEAWDPVIARVCAALEERKAQLV
ncbi:MAG: tetratricopeptide repeat protein [Phenylobacterium sp.]